MNRKSTFYCLFTLFCCLTILAATNHSMAQPYPIGHRQSTFTDASRNNRSIPCEVYYPATVAGDNVPAALGTFPLLVFGHGFVMTWSAYDIYWNNLVPRGYILVFPTTESSFSPSHANFGQDLAYLCAAMQTENTSASSPYYGIVDTASAVMGHSMGGGASFLAKQYNPNITAMAVMAPAVTNPAYAPGNNENPIPCLVFAGANDCVAPPPAHQLPLYDSVFSDCKSYVSITGGDHCQFASSNFNCTLGQLSCSPQASITAGVQQSTLFSLLNPWLDYYLKGNCPQAGVFQSLADAGNGINLLQNCELACPLSAASDELPHRQFKVIFAQDKIRLLAEKNINGQAFEIFDMQGKLIDNGFVTNNEAGLHHRLIKEGIYLFKTGAYVGKLAVYP